MKKEKILEDIHSNLYLSFPSVSFLVLQNVVAYDGQASLIVGLILGTGCLLLLLAGECHRISRCLAALGLFDPCGSSTLQFYLHLKAFGGGRRFEFLKSLVPHSLFVLFLYVLDFLEVTKPCGQSIALRRILTHHSERALLPPAGFSFPLQHPTYSEQI